MKTQTQIISDVHKFQFGCWDEEKEQFIPIDEENRKKIAEKMGCSEKLLETIEENFSGLVNMLEEDLVDIWKKIE